MSELIYKDSSVDWIGNIPFDWGITKLKFISEIVMGQSPASEDCNMEGAGFPFLQGNAEFTDKYPVPKSFCENPNKITEIGDILLSVRAPVGAMNISNERYAIGRGLCAIRSNISMDFLWYAVSVSKMELYSKLKGSTFEAVTTEDVKNMAIVVPSSVELQNKISKYLDLKLESIDSLIKEQEILIKLLEEKRQSMITEAVTKGLNPNVKMKESGVEWIGDIPEHWKSMSLTHVSKITRLAGYEYTAYWEPIEDGEIIALRGQNIGFNSINLQGNEERISTKLSQRLIRSKLFIGDVVFPCVGSIGKAATIYENDKFHINQNIAKLTPKLNMLSDYLTYFLNSRIIYHQIITYNTSEMQPSILVGNLRKFKIMVPPIEEQKNIVSYLKEQLENLFKLQKEINIQIQKLKDYRQSLIYEVVTGKLDVRDIEIES
jgi:type I restriction enzyme, S subunit